ncbi:hypothetical protein [Hyalangium rubrum]|uniref:Lipoprotein n=1 Tax=Hyalangium rubrum TaxID=3103134 RepID=A0ABU5H923_9BACT|nr:hypothetical protein [Hyalangium sp. s54d21]MDY7229348.1 hypothetical protein [Hyalangium sp. s54d21]
MNGRSALGSLLLGLLLPLFACEPEAPSVRLTVLDPAAGEVGASMTAKLELTGEVEDASIRVFTRSMPSTPLRTGQCRETCTLTFDDLPSGTFEVQGFLTPRQDDGVPAEELTSERLSFTLDAQPLTALLIPTSGNTLKVLFLKPVLASSINASTVQLTRTVQTGPNRSDTRTEPVETTLTLNDRTLTIAGNFGAPALLTLKIDGVRDAPGNRCVKTLTASRSFFSNGPDLRDYVTLGSQDRLRRDSQGRLYHLAKGTAWRLDGLEWTSVATWSPDYEQDYDLELGGAPVVAQNTITNVYVPETGTTRIVRELRVQRWDGGAVADLGGVLTTTINQPIIPSLRIDPQGRPVVLVTVSEPSATTLKLLRWNGTQWDSLSDRLNDGSAQYTLGLGGGRTGDVVVGWQESVNGQLRTFLRRVEESGALSPLDIAPGQAVPQLETLTYNTAGQAFVTGVLPGSAIPTLVYRRGASSWEALGGANERITSLTTDPSGAPVIFTVRYDQNGSTVNDPGDPYSGYTPNIYVSLSGYRHDGQNWGPIPGATHPILETQQAPWMTDSPPDYALGPSTVALASHYLPDGTLWLLKLRGFIDFSTGGAGTARTKLLRARHAP